MKPWLSACLAALALAAAATPRLEVPASGVSLGEVAAGEPLSGSVEVRNAGDSPLHVGALLVPWRDVWSGVLFR